MKPIYPYMKAELVSNQVGCAFLIVPPDRLTPYGHAKMGVNPIQRLVVLMTLLETCASCG